MRTDTLIAVTLNMRTHVLLKELAFTRAENSCITFSLLNDSARAVSVKSCPGRSFKQKPNIKLTFHIAFKAILSYLVTYPGNGCGHHFTFCGRFWLYVSDFSQCSKSYLLHILSYFTTQKKTNKHKLVFYVLILLSSSLISEMTKNGFVVPHESLFPPSSGLAATTLFYS